MASMLVHPSASSSSCSFSSPIDVCTPSITHTNGFQFPSKPELWADIDLAESFLISSQFDEAITLSSNILQTLRLTEDDGDVANYNNELDDMMESCGMVLIQALNEGGRENIICSELETMFGHLSQVPPPLFFSGVCLQISAGHYLDAQASIESFLNDWKFTSLGENSCAYKTADRMIRQRLLLLKPEMYIDIAELYCIEVLTKGLGNIDAALNWLQNVALPANRKEDILRRLEEISFGKGKKNSNIHHHKMLTDQSEWDCDSLSVRPSIVSGPSESEKHMQRQHIIKKASHSLSSSFPFFSVTRIVSGWLTCGYSQYGPKWRIKLLSDVLRTKRALTGAAIILILIALYKQKRKISRILSSLGNLGVRNLLHAVYLGLYDFWQLAFNVQLNPLAVATAQYGRA